MPEESEAHVSDCCGVTSKQTESPACPECGRVAKPVEGITVKSLVRPASLPDAGEEPWFFCRTPDCDTVYVSGSGNFQVSKQGMTVRVGVKETEDPIPVCYCFGYDRAAIFEDVRKTGDTEIQREITARVKAGECRCETMNPSGRCCLGEVGKTIQEAKKDFSQGMKQTT